MVGGFVLGLIVFTVGAVLDFAVTTSPYQHGVNIQTVGVIFMVVGAVGAVLSLLGIAFGGRRRRRTVVEDGRGRVVRREEDTYL